MYIIDKWELKNVTINSTNKGINPCLVNEELNLIIKVPHDKLGVFGYYSAGCELGIIGSDSKGFKEEQILAVVQTLNKNLMEQFKQPKYHDLKTFLKNYKGKRRMGNYIAPPQSTVNAINKTLDIIKDEWQEINRFCHQERKDNHYI